MNSLQLQAYLGGGVIPMVGNEQFLYQLSLTTGSSFLLESVIDVKSVKMICWAVKEAVPNLGYVLCRCQQSTSPNLLDFFSSDKTGIFFNTIENDLISIELTSAFQDTTMFTIIG